MTPKLKKLISISAVWACALSTLAQSGHRVNALDNDAWSISEWISVTDAPVITGKVKDGQRAADGANWFATTIENPQDVVSAVWMTTALGVYDLYVNGQLIGDEVLKPGFTHPQKTRRSFSYDITDAYLTGKGESNLLTAQVTPGWWADKIVTPGGHDGMLGQKCAFRGVLELTFADGSTRRYGTDTESWTAGIAGPVKHAAIFDGEVYDARCPAGYESVAYFSSPEINTEFVGEILPSAGAEVYRRDDLELMPVEAYVWRDIEGASDTEYGRVVKDRTYTADQPMKLRPGETLVVDFGQNCAAVPSFVFNAKEGTTLKCEVAELLNDGNGAKSRGMDGPEGSVHRLNLRIPDTGMYLEYTFADSESPVSYTPRCTFLGYRFVSITADDEVEIAALSSIPVTSITKDMEIGSLTTGNDLVNKLISNTLWGQRSNYLSVPTDCPQRNERLGWTADTQVFAETGTYFANTRDFFHKWLRDMRDSQSPEGSYPGVAPTAQYGWDMSRLGWADAGVIVPWTIWKQFGDTAVINESWESMVRYMDHISACKYDHNALKGENGNYQWADWLSYEPLESCSGKAFANGAPLPEAVDYWNYLCASYWVIDAEMMRDMARATGREADAAKYDNMVTEAKQYVADTFLTADGEFKTPILNTMQTPALFALKNGVVTGEAKDRMVNRLRNNFAAADHCLQTGFLGTSILMSTLTDNDMVDIAYELLLQRKNPSWIYSIDNGATTIWERWNSYMLDTGMGPKGMNSFNHYAYGCVCQWLWNTAAGIASDPAAPGFKHIIMSPIPDRRLGHVDAEYISAAGPIRSSWSYDDDVWTWHFSIPEGSTATVTLPGETTSQLYPAGDYTLTVKGI